MTITLYRLTAGPTGQAADVLWRPGQRRELGGRVQNWPRLTRIVGLRRRRMPGFYGPAVAVQLGELLVGLVVAAVRGRCPSDHARPMPFRFYVLQARTAAAVGAPERWRRRCPESGRRRRPRSCAGGPDARRRSGGTMSRYREGFE